MSKHFSVVFHRDNHRCVYCGRDLLIDFETFMLTEEDHLVPGGPDTPDNIVIACAVCNRLKGAYAPAQALDPLRRVAYIAALREYIMSRRAERMADFASWTHPAK